MSVIPLFAPLDFLAGFIIVHVKNTFPSFLCSKVGIVVRLWPVGGKLLHCALTGMRPHGLKLQ